MGRCFIAGFIIWLLATIFLRFAGQYVLQPGNYISFVALLIPSLPLMAIIARRICTGFAVPRQRWPEATIFLVTPTLVLDTFSSALFQVAYPNIQPQAAGLFGGWMLWCCAGALLGASFARNETAP